MNKPLGMLTVGLVLGGLTGFMIAAGYGITLDGHDHGDHGTHSAAHGGAHDHGELLSLPDGASAPTLNMMVMPDPATGWNLHIMTTNFEFAPQNASRDHVDGEGHAHVYVNDKKIARHYGPWLHIADLEPGENVIAVTLNSNDHRELAVGGKALRVEQTITVE
jgi:hypothetical protein